VHDERDKPGSALEQQRQARRRKAHPWPRRLIKGPKTIEPYLRASSPPRYMQRLREIETEYQRCCRQLEAAYAALEDECGRDPELFAQRWRHVAGTWWFEGLNELIREHNQWYPVEANLAMDPRTRDYVSIRGASYRRIELGPDWVLEHFPPEPDGEAGRPHLPGRAPRERL
jgi:hypothetical protein